MSYIKPADNSSDMRNGNKGVAGTNKRYDKVHGNRGKQIQQQKQKGNN